MYYGCVTISNRARWLASCLLLFVALALAIVYSLEVHSCQDCSGMRQGVRQCPPLSDKLFPDRMAGADGSLL